MGLGNIMKESHLSQEHGQAEGAVGWTGEGQLRGRGAPAGRLLSQAGALPWACQWAGALSCDSLPQGQYCGH